MTLELLVCTYNERIRSAAELLLPPMPRVRYLVAWQCTTAEATSMPIPACMAHRNDVRVIRTKTSGLSVNRNVALKHAQGDILLIADDDCRYLPEQLQGILQTYADRPEADVITFRMTDAEGHFHKDYPQAPFDWQATPRGFHVSSWEISFRNERGLPPFDENFGIGAPLLGCAEEEVWLHDALQGAKGIKARYVPYTIGRTPSGTTGTRFLEDRSVQRAKGAMIRLLHKPVPAFLRIVKTALTAPVSLHKRWHIFLHMIRGAKLICRLRGL